MTLPIVINTIVALMALPATYASSNCLAQTQNSTLGLFSNAPLTFTYNLTSATACGQYCETLESCQAWSYVGGSGTNYTGGSGTNYTGGSGTNSTGGYGECDLYKSTALMTAPVPIFVYGVCQNAVNASVASTNGNLLTGKSGH